MASQYKNTENELLSYRKNKFNETSKRSYDSTNARISFKENMFDSLNFSYKWFLPYINKSSEKNVIASEIQDGLAQVNEHLSSCNRSVLADEVLETETEVLKKDYSSIFESWTNLDFVIFTFKFLLWLVIWKFTIIIEFGAVYILCSCFAVIWRGLYSGKSKRKGLSAYSVFNPNCEEIYGTYNAAKVEKEFLFR